MLCLFFSCSEVKAVEDMGAYVAVIGSPDLMFYFRIYPKYKTDTLIELTEWDYLELYLSQIAKNTVGQKVILDFMCHGSPRGLFLVDERFNR
jgi:hypothetical protein